MKERRLTPLRLSLNSLARRPVRTACLSGIVALLAFVLIGGLLLSASLRGGVESARRRLGADALIVPTGYEQSVGGALLRGEPSAFYLDGAVAGELMELEGVAEASAQLFIASFDSPHCSQKVQMIGYDADSDFVVAPWLESAAPGGPGEGEIIVGSLINGKVGGELQFFKKYYKVVGKLEPTGMGFDTSVFLNMAAARDALREYVQLGGEGVPQDGEAISSIVVNVKDGVDVEEFAKNIRLGYRDSHVSVVLPQSLVTDASRGLGALLAVVAALSSLLWVLAAGVLALLFSLSANERMREFGVYRALGATRARLTAIVLTESAVVGLVGAVAGAGLLAVVFLSFERLLSVSLDMPYLRPTFASLAPTLTAVFTVSWLAPPVASLFSALRIGRLAAHSIIREGV
ncbi:MAG: FtsX-like permease family protein [Oscillospiraceae bacterium]|jgi:putative ABC transport system permease protein|nr:FtsX-like permease family protein [Oscillospiraceae bacterium]